MSFFNKVSEAIIQGLPTEAGDEVKRNIEAIVRSNFEKMNLVTRDQLEIQEKILLRTRQKLEEMEQRLQEIEAEIANKSD